MVKFRRFYAGICEVAGELKFEGTTEAGHKVLMDGNKGAEGASPMELVMMAAGGCASVDVVSILQKPNKTWLMLR